MAESFQSTPFPPAITEFCTRELNQEAQQALSGAIAALTPSDSSSCFQLMEELVESSRKSAVVGLEKFPEAIRMLGPSQALVWLDLGVTLAGQSSATAQKFFKGSLDLLRSVDPVKRAAFLPLGLEIADGHYGTVMDFIRACSELPSGIEADDLTLWMQAGLRLAEEDMVLAVEYFRISPRVLDFLRITDIPLWVQLGRRLVKPNSLGKLDYLKVIEYFRLSPETLSALEPPDIRRPFLELGDALAQSSPSLGMDFLRLGPTVLPGLESSNHRRLFVEQARRLIGPAGRDLSVIMDYLREGPKMFVMLGNDPSDFIAWVDAGLALLSRNPERAKAYFSGQSKTGQDTTDRLIGGISLKHVQRVLELYAEGLSGQPVTIRPTTDLPEDLREPLGDSPTTDGRTIYLPDRIRFFPQDSDNFRMYKISTLHEAGHLEFGTYTPDMESIRDVVEAVRLEYGGTERRDRPVKTAGDFFRLFPDPAWAQFLWTLLEDARVDHRLRTEYPGVRRDMDQIIAHDLEARPKLASLPPRMAIQEALLQLSITDTTEVPLELAETLSGAYDLLTEMKTPTGSSTDSLRTLVRLYRFLDEELKRFPSIDGETDPLGKQEKINVKDASTSKGQGSQTLSTSTISYRGTMHPDWVQDRQSGGTEGIDPASLKSSPPVSPPRPEDQKETRMKDGKDAERKTPDPIEAASPAGSSPIPALGRPDERVFFYDEWDQGAQEYRPKWCRLYEQRVHPGSSRIVRETLSTYGPVIRRLRRHFQSLRPEAFRKVKRQASGEEFDLDAVVENRTELRSGRIPHDRLYIKSEKRVRDVATAFLIDMSGSTSRQVSSPGRRVIEIEQEALVLMAEALQAIGDGFAIYGFSGDTKDHVDFYIIKEFSDPFNPMIHERIGATRSLNQNRDGTAIRHAVSKLNQQPARTRLLILLSDGKPLDTDYAGEYSLQDTKKALREARMHGIHPYCITIDPRVEDANRYVHKMYGDVSYTIIDRVATLPDKLPRIYRRLTT